MNRRFKLSGRDILGYLFLGISVIMLGKSLLLCFSSDIWYDELFTVGMIEHSCGDLIAFTARDVHPPLFYCIVKFAVELCKLISAQANPVVTAKIVSVLPFFILLLYSVTFIRKRFGIFTGGLFLFCTIAMPQLSAYTVEVRMYSWALLFVTAAFLHAYGTVTAQSVTASARSVGGAGTDGGAAFVRAHMRQLHAAALVCYGLAAAYTQYFACVAVIMVYLYVLVVWIRRDRQRIKEWFIWVAVSIAGYAPWLYVLFKQITAVRENYWILPLTWRSLGGCVKFIMKPAFTNEMLGGMLAVVMVVMYVSVFVYGAIKLYQCGRENCKSLIKHEENSRLGKHNCRVEGTGQKQLEHFGFAAAGVFVPVGLVLFGFIASVLVRPIFVYRYMIPALGCFWLGFAAALGELWKGYELCKPIDGEITNRDTHMEDGTSEKRNQGMSDNARGATCGKAARWSIENIRKLVCTGIAVSIFIIGLCDYRAFMGEEEYKIKLMRETEEALSSIAPEDIVIYNFDQVQAVTSYYIDETVDSYLWCGTPETLIQEIVRPYGTVEQVSQIQEWVREGRKVWFLGSFNSREDIVAEWEAVGLHVEETGSYLLERYWFNLYKID